MPSPEQVRRIAVVGSLYGLRLPTEPVCRGHQSPAYMVAQLFYDRPAITLWHGSRGSGKSLGVGLANYLLGQYHPDFEAKILGGSQAQSEQIYRAMDVFRKNRPEADAIEEMLQTKAKFRSGATVEMLTASEKSVRGPHIPQLCLDEVDEIEPTVREGSYGMVMRKNDLKASVCMTSTWHRVAGPMADLVARAQAGEFPVGCFCMFDVLERCPPERSGTHLEKCPDCPIFRWCHADRDEHPSGLPRAKRSSGHYDIDAFIQKARGVSARAFESDYLCMRPRASGMWFTDFDESVHVQESAEYRRDEPFHVSIDTGLHSGAVWFQIRRTPDGDARVNVFADYYGENVPGGASGHALAIMDRTTRRTGIDIRSGTVSMDSAANQTDALAGRTIRSEYKRMGCIGKDQEIRPWLPVGPGRPKADTLALIEAMLLSADGEVSLTIHPRCKHLIAALEGYVRDPKYPDYPEDPQHPHEEVIDSLAGGLVLEMPSGRARPTPLLTGHSRKFR